MKYFTINELKRSETATARGIVNEPNAEQVNNLTALVENVLDPVRQRYGKPIIINSGFRCPALNAAVNGSKTSDHMNGNSADLNAGSKEANKELFNLIRSMSDDSEIQFDQLIDEKDFSWVHISNRVSGNRGEVLRYKNGKYERL